MKFGRIVQKITVITESDKNIFEQKVNEYLNQGYELSSTSCGFVDSEKYDFCDVFQAIVVNPQAIVEDIKNA